MLGGQAWLPQRAGLILGPLGVSGRIQAALPTAVCREVTVPLLLVLLSLTSLSKHTLILILTKLEDGS